MSTVYNYTITGTVVVDDEFDGYSKDDLETELSMALDDMQIQAVGVQAAIGTISISDVSLTGPMEVME